MRRKNYSNLLGKPANMVHAPTVVATDGPNGSQSESKSAPYFSITVDTTDESITDPVKIVLFDTAQGYQLKTSYAMPIEVNITASGDNYQSLLNDFAHVTPVIDVIKMQLAGDQTKYDLQFAERINLIECQVGMDPSVVKTLYPAMGLSEAQYHQNITHFTADIRVSHRHALVYIQQPGLITTFGFFQVGQLGRKIQETASIKFEE